MKRKNKCIATKKAYATTTECLEVIKRVYRNQRKKRLRYYECPICLDFHLTHKGTEQELRAAKREWKQLSSEKHKVHVENQVKKESRRIRDNGIVNKKAKTILVGVLPRAERLRVLAEMKAKNAAIDQRFNLWKSLKALFSVDILIGKRGR